MHGRIEVVIKEMDAQRDAQTIGQQAEFVEVTVVTVHKIKPEGGVTFCIFRQVTICGKVRVVLFVIDDFGIGFTTVDFRSESFGIVLLDLGLKP